MDQNAIYTYAGFLPEEFDELESERKKLNQSETLFRYRPEAFCFERIESVSLQPGNKSFSAAEFRSHLFLVLAHLPDAVTRMIARGIPDAVIKATYSDISIWYRHFKRELDMPGLSPEIMGWLSHHFKGEIFRLGRLQFEMTRLNQKTNLLPLKTPVLGVHIPENGRLTESLCNDSFAMAERFFTDTHPYPFKAYIINSWFMDPEFLSLLPANSNILRFATRFTSIPSDHKKNKEIYRRILGESAIYPGKKTIVPRTSLQNIVYPYYLQNKLFGEGAGIIPRKNKKKLKN